MIRVRNCSMIYLSKLSHWVEIVVRSLMHTYMHVPLFSPEWIFRSACPKQQKSNKLGLFPSYPHTAVHSFLACRTCTRQRSQGQPELKCWELQLDGNLLQQFIACSLPPRSRGLQIMKSPLLVLTCLWIAGKVLEFIIQCFPCKRVPLTNTLILPLKSFKRNIPKLHFFH